VAVELVTATRCVCALSSGAAVRLVHRTVSPKETIGSHAKDVLAGLLFLPDGRSCCTVEFAAAAGPPAADSAWLLRA
jgi:hypothetical protein